MSELSLSMSISRKVNLGNYESADVFISISGITAETTSEQMDELLEKNGALAYGKLRADLTKKLDEVKK